MARRPYILCRFEIHDGDEVLDATGQLQFLEENQGTFQEHQGRSGNANAVIMEVERFRAAKGFNAASFYIGYQPGYRTKRGYDHKEHKRTSSVEPDDNIRSAHIVAVPRLNAFAIEDRTGEHNIPHVTAVTALRSVVRAVFEDGDLNVTHLTDADVRRIVRDWDLIQYDYVVRPLNPIRPSDFSEMRSEKMKLDKVAMDVGRLLPAEGASIEDNGGLFHETELVVRAGYGQSGGRAVTPDGQEARFPRPRFHMDKSKNFAEREKSRYLKILFEVDEEGTPDRASIARTLVQFYGNAS